MTDALFPDFPPELQSTAEMLRKLLMDSWEEGYRTGAESTMKITSDFVRNLGRHEVADILDRLKPDLLAAVDEHIVERRGR